MEVVQIDLVVDHLVPIIMITMGIWDLEPMMLETIISMGASLSLIRSVRERRRMGRRVHLGLGIINYLASLQIYLHIVNHLKMKSSNMFEIYI